MECARSHSISYAVRLHKPGGGSHVVALATAIVHLRQHHYGGPCPYIDKRGVKLMALYEAQFELALGEQGLQPCARCRDRWGSCRCQRRSRYDPPHRVATIGNCSAGDQRLEQIDEVESQAITSLASAPISRAILSPQRRGALTQSAVFHERIRPCPHSSSTVRRTAAMAALATRRANCRRGRSRHRGSRTARGSPRIWSMQFCRHNALGSKVICECYLFGPRDLLE